ncbi:MAG TPA: phosphotransferase family protein [Xanthobacteraceae bacterium]|nr:phosphotransferase family protein [Xanthobacteraceae bacterium]
MPQSHAPAEEAFVGTKPVEERHRLDEAKLDAWLKQNIEGYRGPLTLLQFKGGQSNPTYRIDTPTASYVLRRKPFGKLLPSAHAVDREFRVISALHKQGFAVARPYALCVDDGVIGAAFYIMSMVKGRVFWNATLPAQQPAERRAIFESEIATLAALHQFDPEKIGLGDYGKPGNYFARQIDRWSKQYRASETKLIPAMDRLIAWLPTSVPPQDRVSVVHGDYRLDNMIFHPVEPRVVAVLDWELSTLGDPLADFTYFLMNWAMPPEGRSGLLGLDLTALGIPTMAQTIEFYCRRTERSGIPTLDWYFAYNLFRLAAISQGIAKRVVDGTAANERAREAGERATPLAEAAWNFAERAGA